MAQPWYDDLKPAGAPGTHAAGDDGEDLNTPDRTPVAFMDAGQVIDASYHVYGGQVVIHLPSGWDEYFIHLNNIDVKPGDVVMAGERIGDTGGGLGDLVLHDGKVQPAQDMSWYEGHSSGYHSELGFFQDFSARGDMNQFNDGWGKRYRQLDPRPRIEAYAKGDHPPIPPHGQPGSNPGGFQWPANPFDPNTWINDVVKAFGFSSPQNMLQRLAVGAAGASLAVIGLLVALQPGIEQGVQGYSDMVHRNIQEAAKVAKAAAI